MKKDDSLRVTSVFIVIGGNESCSKQYQLVAKKAIKYVEKKYFKTIAVDL